MFWVVSKATPNKVCSKPSATQSAIPHASDSEPVCRNTAVHWWQLLPSLLSLFSFFCRVVQSKNTAFPVGTCVVAHCGWRTHTVCDGTPLTPILPNWPEDVSLSLALGTIGMPGWDRCLAGQMKVRVSHRFLIMFKEAKWAVAQRRFQMFCPVKEKLCKHKKILHGNNYKEFPSLRSKIPNCLNWRQKEIKSLLCST